VEIEKLCQCGFTSEDLTEGEFQCLSDPEEVTYRARLSSTTRASSSDIIADIEEWVTSGEASLVVQGVRRPLDSTCHPIAVESFSAQDCGPTTDEPPPTTDEATGTGSSDTQSDNTAAIVGGVVAVILGVTIAITVVVVLRWRRGGLSIQKQTQ